MLNNIRLVEENLRLMNLLSKVELHKSDVCERFSSHSQCLSVCDREMMKEIDLRMVNI